MNFGTLSKDLKLSSVRSIQLKHLLIKIVIPFYQNNNYYFFIILEISNNE